MQVTLLCGCSTFFFFFDANQVSQILSRLIPDPDGKIFPRDRLQTKKRVEPQPRM
jgi:hypothetical protein